MKKTAPEIHMWMGLTPPLYVKLGVLPFKGTRVTFAPGFKSANDEIFGEKK